MQRLIILIFGIAAYGVFFVTFLYLIAFVGSLQLTPLAAAFPPLTGLVPYSVDAGRETGTVPVAVLADLALIALFGLQHSVMARSGFKAWLKRSLPAAAERSIYVLLASLVLILLFWQWRPIPARVWEAESAWATALGWGYSRSASGSCWCPPS